MVPRNTLFIEIQKDTQNWDSPNNVLYADVVKSTGTSPTIFADAAALSLKEIATIFRSGNRQHIVIKITVRYIKISAVFPPIVSVSYTHLTLPTT